jgi:hypothetical protein
MVQQTYEVWLRTDEIGELIDAIEFSAEVGTKVQTSISHWKWLILALHNALQGACTCALRGHDTSGLLVLTKETARAVWTWLETTRQNPGAPKPEEKLAPMLDLYKRTRRQLPEPHRLLANSERDRDVRKLNDLRNTFTHFIPQGFSLEVSGMPRIALHCCNVIEHLCINHPTFWHHLNAERRQRIRLALDQVRRVMEAIQLAYDTRSCELNR